MNDDHLMDVLTRGHKPIQRNDDRAEPPESSLPDPSKGYEPCSRPSQHGLYTLHCILGADGYRSFQYVHLDSDSSLSADGKGQVIRLRFSSSKITAVTIRGRNLWRLYDQIHQHKMAWVMRMDRDRDFAAGNEPVVTAIDIEEVKSPADNGC
jgi:hypothetical protein